MKKGLFVKSKGLAILAGILMAAVAVYYLISFIQSGIDFASPYTYSMVLWIIAMFGFALTAILLVKKNIKIITLPAAVFLLISMFYSLSVIYYDLIDFQTFNVAKTLYLLLLLLTLALFLLAGANPKVFKTTLLVFSALLALWSLHAILPYISAFIQDPKWMIDTVRTAAAQNYDLPTILYAAARSLMNLPIFLFALSLDKNRAQADPVPAQTDIK